MVSGDTNNYALFTGCLIPSKYPFLEKASMLVFEKLGVNLHEIEGASCCPNQMAIQSSDKRLWEVLSARNLCIAEEIGYDILSLCNGCYDTLKTNNSKLKNDEKYRSEINELLSEFGLEFKGTIDVKHIIQVLHDDIGLNTIEGKLENPLRKLNCAPFVGCHVKRPMDRMGFDNPEDPYYLEELIKAIDGEIITYSDEHSCCSGGLSIAREHDVVPAARRIFKSVIDAGGDAIVVNCPYCFAQFYRGEKMVNDIYPDKIEVPVFYITQLMGLAFGFTEEELGMPMHYENTAGTEKETIEKILSEEIEDDLFDDTVTREQLEICSKCLACIDDCSTATATTGYHPEEILNLVLEGKTDEAIERPDIWFCMNCHDCIQKCPQNFGMVKLLVRLKNLAVEKGIYPEVVNHRYENLKETSYSFSPNDELKECVGLCKSKGPEMKAFKKLLNEVRGESNES